jgi:hypothetical protein
LSRQSAHRWRKDYHPYAPAALCSKEHYFSASGTLFCYSLSKPQGLVRPEGLGKSKEFIHLVGSRTRDLPACSLVPYPLRYRVPTMERNHVTKEVNSKDGFVPCLCSHHVMRMYGETEVERHAFQASILHAGRRAPPKAALPPLPGCEAHTRCRSSISC